MTSKKTKRSRVKRRAKSTKSRVKSMKKTKVLSIQSRTMCLNGDCHNVLCVNGKCRKKHMKRPIKNSVVITLKKSKKVGKTRKSRKSMRKSRKLKKKSEV